MIPEPTENNEPTATAQSRCGDCKFYSGDSGNKPHHLMCAVNIPRPTPAEFRKASGSLPHAWHDCKDFEKAGVPVLGSYEMTTINPMVAIDPLLRSYGLF
jgi:hypothetical protein